MKPVDPRLVRQGRVTRVFLLAAVALGLAGAGLVVAQAVLIADIVVSAFQHHTTSHRALFLLAATAAGRALVAWLTELAAHRASAGVKSRLRLRLLAHATATRDHRTGELTALATRGIDALDDYFARYLPQLALAVVVPAVVLARIVVADWISALTIAVTLPLIPVFMILIGWATQARMDRQWQVLSRLSHHFLDVVAGLPTLKVFGRAKAQAATIRTITADYRRATLRTLRIAFLSSFALELLATISVALVAVGVGMRLVHGELDLYTGLVVLILAPEAYLPLRQVGAQYHAAAEGLAAADQVLTTLERELPSHGANQAPLNPAITLHDVSVHHAGRATAALPPTTLTLAPGETLALTGPSGAGKSTLLHTILGLTHPTTGQVRLNGTDLPAIDPSTWHAQIAWIPQHPHLFAGTVADNVRLTRPTATDAEVRTALDHAAAGDLDPHRHLGEQGAGLSAGQRQRVALARAFLADRPIVLLDEPTTALDGATEADVVEAIGRLAATRTTILVAHRPALLHLADHVISLSPPSDDGVAHHRAAGAAAPAEAPASNGQTATARRGRGGEADPEHSRVMCGPQHGVHLETDSHAARTSHRSGAVAPDRPRTREPSDSAPGAPREPAPGAPRDSAPGEAREHAGPLARVRAAARPLHSRFALALLLGALALASAVGLMATSGWLISRASQHPPVLYLMVAVTATRTFGIGRAVFRYAERLVSHDAALRFLAALRVSVYACLERLAPAGLRQARRGDLLSRLVSDVDALQDYFLRWLLPAATAATVSLAAVGFTAALLPAAGAALAVGLAATGIAVPALTAALSRRTERDLAPDRGTLATRTVDLLSGTGELTVAGALPARLDAVRAADATLTRLAARSAARTGMGAGLTTLLSGLTVTAAAWAGASAGTSGRLDGVLVAVVVLTPLAAFEAVTGLPSAVQYRQRTKRAAERVHEVLDAPAPVRERPWAPAEPARRLADTWQRAMPVARTPHRTAPAELRAAEPRHPATAESGTGRTSAPAGQRTAGRPAPGEPGTPHRPALAAPHTPAEAEPRVTLRGITARHPGQHPSSPPALADLDLDLAPGCRIAVVGPSGSGKTTLAHVLLRFLDPASGSYRFTAPDAPGHGAPAGGEGVDATALDADAVRRLVGLCAQDAHLFDSTLRENLRLARPGSTDADLHRALAAARLDTWVHSLPEGLDTPVGEHGARLSGGQRQRLALARALLADFPVLVLDEPAEHLDLHTADALTADLLAVTEDRATATLLITHRLQGLDAVDEVIVLDAGRVAERGTYAQLAATEDGPFRRMLDREAATAATTVMATTG